MLIAIHILLQLVCIGRVLLRPMRNPSTRIAWIVVILAIPFLGLLAYALLGEITIGQSRLRRMLGVIASLPDPADAPGYDAVRSVEIPARHEALFVAGRSLSGYDPVGGNRAEIMPDTNGMIDRVVADIDAATDHAHLLFYAWLDDRNGRRVASALARAARRGVACRVMVDDLGSWGITESGLWSEMEAAGVKLGVSLPLGNPLLRLAKGRIDLRNHRKVIVIDDRITYCGSQNCADPEFGGTPPCALWVDTMMRFEGPIARQCQHLFAGDWMTFVKEDISEMLTRPLQPSRGDVTAQLVAAGPGLRHATMPEMFQSLMYAARRELIISTPYYVPDEPLQSALCAAGWRGIDVTIILPAESDHWVVAAAGRSHYQELLQAGVKVREFTEGMLHAKTLTLDGEVGLIGSANLDRRSFDLNFENNILFTAPAAAGALREQQLRFIGCSRAVTADHVAEWPAWRRLGYNAVSLLNPLL
ncbi:cardiolipin synthase [Elioraea rosea]|uniref:cardiolipin synthase n=1 Tax=Elioraea rosea TaxID=2492390 RepID=UPI00118450EB|nr:cardiolipin synthase [Elioraea rosea]